jgi:hypothetical protein
MEDFLKTTGTPGHGVPYDGEVKYGPRAEHCWNGDPTLPNAYSRLHYNQMYLPKIMERIAKTAPCRPRQLAVLKAKSCRRPPAASVADQRPWSAA